MDHDNTTDTTMTGFDKQKMAKIIAGKIDILLKKHPEHGVCLDTLEYLVLDGISAAFREGILVGKDIALQRLRSVIFKVM